MSRVALAALLLLLFPRASEASVSFRFLVWVDYEDAGQASAGNPPLVEDFWNTMPMSAAQRGAYVYISKGNWHWDGYLGDGVGSGSSGYTPTLTPSGGDAGTYFFTIWSDGVLQSNHLYGRNENGSVKTMTGVITISGSGQHDINTYDTFTAETEDVFWAYSAMAWALHHHSGGLTSTPIYTYIGNGNPGLGQGHCNCASEGVVNILDGGTNDKYILTHELGHAIGYLKVGNKIGSPTRLVGA